MCLNNSKPVDEASEEAPLEMCVRSGEASGTSGTSGKGKPASPVSPPVSPPVPQGGMGLAMRMGTEMVVATLIGLGMGYFLDKWLETLPWMTLLFFLFGSAAGFRNMYRVAHLTQPKQAELLE